jgi:hypothetical protein
VTLSVTHRSLLARVVAQAQPVSLTAPRDAAGGAAFDADVDDIVELEKLGYVSVEAKQKNFTTSVSRWTSIVVRVTARGRRVLETAPLVDAVRDLGHAVEDMARGDSDEFASTLERVVTLLAPGAPLGALSARRLPSVDFDGWYQAGLATFEGSTGSARLRYPADLRERVALRLALLRHLSGSDGSFFDYYMAFLSSPDTNLDTAVRLFVQRTVEPFFRDWLTIMTPDVFPDGDPRALVRGPGFNSTQIDNSVTVGDVSGPNARVLYRSTDHSHNEVTYGAPAEAFEAIRRLVDLHVSDDQARAELRNRVETLERAADAPTAGRMWARFAGLAADHIALFQAMQLVAPVVVDWIRRLPPG